MKGEEVSRPAILFKILLSRLDGHGPLDVLPLSVCGILRSDLFGSQINNMLDLTVSFIVVHRPVPAAVSEC